MKTAEEFLKQKPFIHGMTRHDQCVAMIEFAKLHCIEQARVINKKAFVKFTDLTDDTTFDYTDVLFDGGINVEVDKDSILNAYDLSNIK